ncbi:hypothetical protein H9W84_05365 [Moraxella sp. PS-22]|uniref:Uncharacterized protein n=1 Tax=Moraxella tetraodonis TaxID=2767221 RepID=A0A9X2A1P5_9GAMM|nr:hypothetical protein [Moraxella tetraodonis]MCG8147555.1 hypothetical protein [Moraxella tetraodonis]
MSMIFPQNTLSKKMLTPLLMACFALTVVGCSRNEQKDEQTGSAASSEQKPIETSDIACNNEKATSAIHSYLANRIDQQAKKQSDIIQQQAGTIVDMTILQNGLSQVAINLEGVNGSNGKCQATVSFNMPQAQLDNADKIYTRLKMPAAAEQITSRGYQLQNSTLVANNVGFGLSASGTNYQVNSTTGDDVIGLVGEIMANSALAQTLTQPSNTPLAGSSAGAIPVVPTVTSKPSVAANNSQNSTTKPVKKQTTEEPKTDSEKNDSEKTKTDVTTTSDKKNTASDSADKKSVKKSESTTANADSKSTATKSAASTSTDKSTKSVSHEKVPTDTNVKLTIEEKNEQY